MWGEHPAEGWGAEALRRLQMAARGGAVTSKEAAGVAHRALGSGHPLPGGVVAVIASIL